MRIRYAIKTDVGMRRASNEDYFGCIEDERLFIVADGMGGHAMGEVAAKMAVDTLTEFYRQTAAEEAVVATLPHKVNAWLPTVENRLACSVKLANWKVYETGLKNPGFRGMGTTLIASVIEGEKIYFANVGDSRAYRIRDDGIKQMTRDHSLFEDYQEAYPDITEEEKKNFPHKNVVTRSIGLTEGVHVDIWQQFILDGDTFLLCSDGLSGVIEDRKLCEIVHACRGDLEQAVTMLIDTANQNGGVDNITVILIHCDGQPSTNR